MNDLFAWTFPGGKLRYIRLSETTTNGTVTVSLQPAVGKKWVILYATGEHDDGVARSSYWMQYDGTNTDVMSPGASIAASVKCVLGAVHHFAAGYVLYPRLVASYTVYFKFRAEALATTKKAIVYALVLEIDE
jgi:hypothetical protein